MTVLNICAVVLIALAILLAIIYVVRGNTAMIFNDRITNLFGSNTDNFAKPDDIKDRVSTYYWVAIVVGLCLLVAFSLVALSHAQVSSQLKTAETDCERRLNEMKDAFDSETKSLATTFTQSLISGSKRGVGSSSGSSSGSKSIGSKGSRSKSQTFSF
jgi:hypothetical protein